MFPVTVEQTPQHSLLTSGPKLPQSCGFEAFSQDALQDSQQQRKTLLSSLRGQTIHVPDLTPLFKHWPTKTNPELNRMRADIRDWLNATIPPGKTLDALQASDFGLFGSTWWPCAAFDKLQIVTYLAVWLFTWDDEIDLNDGTMWDEFGAAQIYRDQTLAYVRYSLDIETQRRCPEVTNRIILNFAPIGAALKKAYTLDQRKMVYEEMQFCMNMSEQEQRLRLSGAIPSLDEFWRYRLGISAVTVCLALNEFSYDGMRLPAHFYSDEDVKALFRYTNTIISATNDLLSVKKEIKREAIDSLVPIIFFHGGDVQRAVGDVVAFIKDEIANMDGAARSLERRYEGADESIRRQVRDFIDGCKQYTTGNLTWSLETDRYAVDRVDGEIVMTL